MRKKLRKLASDAVWSACRLLPVKKDKVVFCSAGGRGFGDNPKAVALALMELHPGLDLVWLTKNMNIDLPEGVRPCPYGTPRAVMELSTAKVWSMTAVAVPITSGRTKAICRPGMASP